MQEVYNKQEIKILPPLFFYVAVENRFLEMTIKIFRETGNYWLISFNEKIRI